METTYTVTGMTCEHCVKAVESELAQIPGVTAVEVELSSGRVVLSSTEPVPADAVAVAVEEAGYEVA